MTEKSAKKGTPMSVQEAGRKGGQKVRDRYGKEYYEKIGRIGGQKGGKTVREKYGVEFYRTIGFKGGQRVKELIEEGKRVQANKKT